jgi:predicted ATPase/DNA-binding winged helix-turn-helix (wHTH) protein
MVRLSNTQEGSARTDGPTHGSTFPQVAAFGAFRLRVTERILEKDGIPVKIGSRAIDILLTLVERAPNLVIKRDLISRVWGNLVIDESSLRWHIASLRKTLGDDESGVRYVTNVVGRGYCFAAPVTWTTKAPIAAEGEATSPRATRLPRQPLRIVGRDGAVRDLRKRLIEQRFVSIVGAGGIGKTTVALAVAHELLAEFPAAIHFLDLAAVEDPRLVAGALASELGISVVSDNPLPVILTFLREQRTLLVLDSCEHVIGAVAALAEGIFREAPQVHILATSRESLRAQGERVHHLPPLECPPADAVSLTATQALAFPAVQLFVEQVAASGYPFELGEADAPIVGEICRRLDGIALALELAACRVGVYGVQGTASLLDKQFRLLWHGRRTALPRHQTLSATLDWSYNLLSGTEQRTLCHLSVFVGSFSLEAALGVITRDLDAGEVTETLATLVEKSLVTLDRAPTIRYRLLDTTRAYAWQKLVDRGEHLRTARRHCEYLAQVLEQFNATAAIPCSPEAVNFFAANLGNLRAALEWSFSEQGDSVLGARVTAASAALFFELTLLPECITWTERALRALDAVGKGTRAELQLQTCFALPFAVTKGNVWVAHNALMRALELAESLRDPATQLLLLHALYRWQTRSGDFRGLAVLTSRIEAVAREIDDPLADAIAHALVAITCYYIGDGREVPRHAQLALSGPVRSATLNASTFGYLNRTAVRNVLARSLWALGLPDQALVVAGEAAREATDLGDPQTLAYVLGSILFVYVRTGQWLTAEEVINRLHGYATKHHLSTYVPLAVGWQGHLAVLRGDLSRGIELLQTALADLRVAGYELYSRLLNAALVDGLAKAGQLELAYSRVCEAVAWSESHGPSADLLELLRVKGETLIAMSPSDTRQGEACLQNSLDLARQQGALSMELRSGMSLARIWAENGQVDEALGLLAPIHSRFTEGFHTSDLVAAANLLDELRSRR